MPRSLTAKEILGIRRKTITLEGEWGRCIGTMDRSGVVFFWGNSGNGKSAAVISLCKELTRFGKVLFITLEEGFSLSFQNTLKRFDMYSCGSRFQVLESATPDELVERLTKPRSPEFIVIDSYQYMGMTYREYLEFKGRLKNKLLIFVSHADGRQPAGRAARSVKYDAMLKIWVEGFVAFSNGRFIGETGKAVIWKEGHGIIGTPRLRNQMSSIMKAMEKKTKKNDYSRFYALLKQNPMLEKEEIVSQFTNGRTTHVSQMSRQEFIRMCDSLQYGSPTEQRARELSLKRARSAALLRIGRLGIKTIDNWDGINAFVANPKIAGKKFYDLGVDELNSLVRKLESIIRRGGLKSMEEEERRSEKRKEVVEKSAEAMSTMALALAEARIVESKLKTSRTSRERMS